MFVVELISFVVKVYGWFLVGGSSVVADFLKITIQSNVIGLLVCGAYLQGPHGSIGKTNILFIFISGILGTSAVGFGLLLYPIYNTGLKDYLTSDPTEGLPSGLSTFQSVGNHAAPQVVSVAMLRYVFRSSTKGHLFTASYKQVLKYTGLFCFSMTFIHIIYSGFDKVHPAYGIFSNFNWSSNFKTNDGNIKFNLYVVFFTTAFVISVLFAINTYFGWLSLKMDYLKNKSKFTFPPSQIKSIKTLT